MAMERSHVLSIVSVAVATCFLTGRPAQAASKTIVNAGQAFYMQYCAKCHGAEGKGDGPAAKTQQTPPSDLTQLAKKNGGKFPYMEVLDILDGETPFPGHGSSEMPKWGQTFQGDVGSSQGGEEATRLKLMEVTDFLRSIQQK